MGLELSKEVTGTITFNKGEYKMDTVWIQNNGFTFAVADPNKIFDVDVKNNRVVICTFADGQKTKSVCSPDDEFDLGFGIAVCVIKRWNNGLTVDGIEHKAHELFDYKYHVKKINDAKKIYYKKLQDAEKKHREQLESEAVRLRRAEKKRAKKEAKKQAEIDKIASAVKEAMER